MKGFLEYEIQIHNHKTKKGYSTKRSISFDSTKPADLKMWKNPSVMYNQIEQNLLIENPEFDNNDIKIHVFYIGDLIKA